MKDSLLKFVIEEFPKRMKEEMPDGWEVRAFWVEEHRIVSFRFSAEIMGKTYTCGIDLDYLTCRQWVESDKRGLDAQGITGAAAFFFLACASLDGMRADRLPPMYSGLRISSIGEWGIKGLLGEVKGLITDKFGACAYP